MIEVELESAVGPRIMIWGEVDCEDIDDAVPDGWSVDWDTTPSPLSSVRDGQRGYAHPLTLNLTTLNHVRDEAMRDAESFAREFPGELLDPSWVAKAWQAAPNELRTLPGLVVDGVDYGFAIYRQYLADEVQAHAARLEAYYGVAP